MIHLTRRQLIAGSAYGAGGLLLPVAAAAQLPAQVRGFTHGVASGEPDTDSMLFWTRYVGDGSDATVRVEVSETPAFVRVVGGAQVITGPWRDWTVKATVGGLEAGTSYWYRFIGPDGSRSPVGRTRTLAADPREARIAVFSCSNAGFGWFNAYAHAAARDDIDLCFHLGDYIYEPQLGLYPTLAEAVRTDLTVPAVELVALSDYRARHAAYRTDPDLQALHARYPMVASMEDHDTVNDGWEGGAGGHQPNEGEFWVRKAAAMQAWHEWLPVDETPWKAYRLGRLATLFRTDTRMIARSPQAQFAAARREGRLDDFAAHVWPDPARTIWGTTQEHWLYDGLRDSVRGGTTWQVVGSGCMMGDNRLPATADEWLLPTARDVWKSRFAASYEAAKFGIPSNMDSWQGYPAARGRFLAACAQAGANAVVVSGDSHNAWAYDMKHAGYPAAVEFAGQSVTSPGVDEATGGRDPGRVTGDYVRANSELRWMDSYRRGYMLLALSRQAAVNEWVFMDTIRTRSTATLVPHRMRVRAGRRTLETI